VNGREWLGHSWVRDLTDAPGARYLAAEGVPPSSHPDVKLYRRQVALVDVDEGTPSPRPLTPRDLHPKAKLDPDVVTPNSYVFDVFRVSGGTMHTYSFRGFIADDVQVNMVDRQPAPDDEYLKPFPLPDRKFTGVAPEVVQATWRMAIEQGMNHVGEKLSSGPNFRPDSPRKYTRLHLLGQKGARLLQADLYCSAGDYSFTNLYVQRRGESAEAGKQALETVFPAIIEPYAGEPFVRDLRLVPIANNETDALRAVAVEVRTANGHMDFCFADGRPELIRALGDARIAGEFAYYSRDANGVRLVSLTGGTLLQTREVTLAPPDRQQTAKVVRANYPEKSIELDAVWNAPALAGRVVEIGAPGPGGQPGHWTSATIARAEPMAGGTRLHMQEAADFYLSRVKEVETERGIVHCGLAFAQQEGAPVPGLDKNWVASNEAATRFWRAEYLGGAREEGRFSFRLTGGPVSPADFGESQGFRLWEYGVGDIVRQSTFACLRRLDPARADTVAPAGNPAVYELIADVDLTVGLPGKTVEISRNQADWQPMAAQVADAKVEAHVRSQDLGPEGRLFLRVR
jgi:hypothetical protein